MTESPLDGACTCGAIRYRLLQPPMFVHACRCPPDIHIFTSSKQPWVRLPEDVPAVAEYYRRSAYWPPASVERYRRAIGRA